MRVWRFFAFALVAVPACGSSNSDDGTTIVILGASGSSGNAGTSNASGNGGALAGSGGTNAGGLSGASGQGGAVGGSPSSGGQAGEASSGHAGSPSGASGQGGATSGSSGQAGSASGASGQAGASCTPVDLAPTLTFQLDSAPFPSADHPSVAVHVPTGFLPCEKPGLIVYFHGFDNCVTNVIGSVDTPCEPGGDARASMHLSDQLDAAHVNAILVAVQLSYDMATGDPGALTKPGSLHTLLHELFTAHLDAMLGASLDVEDFDRVVLGSHSGGYWATEEVLSVGMVPQITEVDLYDSLYAYESVFESFITSNIQRFSSSAPRPYRFTDVYTSGGGTLDNSQSMAASVTTDLSKAGLSSSILNDETTDTLDTEALSTPVLFKQSALAHDDVPRYYFGRFAALSGFTPLPLLT